MSAKGYLMGQKRLCKCNYSKDLEGWGAGRCGGYSGLSLLALDVLTGEEQGKRGHGRWCDRSRDVKMFNTSPTFEDGGSNKEQRKQL